MSPSLRRHASEDSYPISTPLPIGTVAVEQPEESRARPTVIVIDPRPLTRHSVSQLLERSLTDATVVAVSHLSELLSDCATNPPPLRLIVLNVGGARVRDESFLNELALLRERLPDVPVVVVADRSHIEDVAEMLRRGVRGYIPTTLHPTVAIGAVRLVQAGGTFIPENAFLEMLDDGPPRRSGARELAPHHLPGAEFTPRQRDVLNLLKEGKSNKTIARDLHMQESTVKVHVRQIMKKLKAANRTQAVVIACQLDKEASDC